MQPTTNSSTSDSVATTERNPSPEDNWEEIDLSSTEYARRRKELMQLINDLRSVGQVGNLDATPRY